MLDIEICTSFPVHEEKLKKK
jgi:hypothetical protein